MIIDNWEARVNEYLEPSSPRKDNLRDNIAMGLKDKKQLDYYLEKAIENLLNCRSWYIFGWQISLVWDPFQVVISPRYLELCEQNPRFRKVIVTKILDLGFPHPSDSSDQEALRMALHVIAKIKLHNIGERVVTDVESKSWGPFRTSKKVKRVEETRTLRTEAEILQELGA